MALKLIKSAQVVAARIVLWAGTVRAAATAAMMGATLAVTISAVVVELALGVRQIEVGIALWIRVTAALEVVAVASPIPGALATAAIAVVRVGQVLLPCCC